MRYTRPTPTAARVLAVAAVALGAGQASGQTALDRNMRSNVENPYRLGTGLGLESRLERTAPRNRGLAATRVRTEFAMRNAIVTGNAPGGASFRGDLGYGAANEFRGELGSDDLFAFRRDSLYSGLSGRGIRGLEGLQYQFSLTTGTRTQSELIGSPIVQRGFAGLSGADVLARQPGAAETFDDSRLREPSSFDVDRFREQQELRETTPEGGLLGTLRSSSAYRANMATTPSILATAESPTGERFGLTASGLSGVRYVPLVDAAGRTMAQDAGAGRPAGSTPGLSESAGQSEARRAGGQSAVMNSQSSYQTLIDRLARFDATRSIAQRQADQREAAEELEAQGDTGPMLPSWEQDLLELRQQLLEQQAQPVAPRTLLPPAVQRLLEQRDARQQEQNGEADDEPRQGPLGLNERAVDLIRQGGGEVPELLRGDAAAGPFRQHLEAGARLMSEGRYFDAEERYTRALSAMPGDPVAAIGRVHAQLGAGLHVSAVMNLRETLRGAPELVGVRHDADLLPKADRLGKLKSDFEATIRKEEVGEVLAPGQAREAGLMLAYLAFQTEDRPLLERALGVARRQQLPGDEALLELLERVWLAEEQPDAGDGG